METSLPPPSRLLRLTVTGGECTGKTTLARALAAHLGVPCCDEYARTYARAHADRALTVDDVMPIARGQRRAQSRAWVEARRRGCRYVVFDTDLLSTLVYAQAYYGHTPPVLQAWVRRSKAHLYILCSPTAVAWTDDGVRDRPHERDAMHERFRQALAAFGCTVVLAADTDVRDRVARALASLAQQRARRS